MQKVPFTVRRIVKWGETDPAGIVYTPRFLDYAVEATESFFIEIIGVDWYRLRQEFNMGSPLAHASLDFSRPLQVAEPFELVVEIADLGRSAITFRVIGYNDARERCFEAKLVTVIIDKFKFKAIPIPDQFRAPIEAYRQVCEGQSVPV